MSSSSPAHHRQRPGMSSPLQTQQQHQQSQAPSRQSLTSMAESLSRHTIAQHRDTTVTVCKTLQTRIVELRGESNALKRSASEMIRSTGKKVRRDLQRIVDTVHARRASLGAAHAI